LAGAAVLMLASNVVLLLGLPIQFQIVLKGVVIVLAAACYVRR
jgi:ribose/xylose/arabinose/galactoside ABC-type transport system permease subunit